MRDGHGSITLGSEMAGGVKICVRWIVYFYIPIEDCELRLAEEEEKMRSLTEFCLNILKWIML